MAKHWGVAEEKHRPFIQAQPLQQCRVISSGVVLRCDYDDVKPTNTQLLRVFAFKYISSQTGPFSPDLRAAKSLHTRFLFKEGGERDIVSAEAETDTMGLCLPMKMT